MNLDLTCTLPRTRIQVTLLLLIAWSLFNAAQEECGKRRVLSCFVETACSFAALLWPVLNEQLRELYDAKQTMSQVCWTLPACMTLVTAAILLNRKRCLLTALVKRCVFHGPASPAIQCSTGCACVTTGTTVCRAGNAWQNARRITTS